MAAQVWSNVQVAMQSALATAVTITGITKASPGVVSHSGTDPSDGDYVLLLVDGMTELNERVFRVANQAAGSFELEGEDTTDFGTFSSGTFAVITFGTSLGTIQGVSASGGETEFADTTTIHDKIRTQIPTVASALSFSLQNRWEPDDAGLAAMKTANDSKAQRAIKFTFASGAISTFYGYVGFVFVPTGNAQDVVTTPATITASNSVTNYSS